MDDIRWRTGEAHADNNETMSDYLNHVMPDIWVIDMVDGTYAEITTDAGEQFAVHASGNGDAFNHLVTFEPLPNAE